jgi:methylenetetrahydrofolate reductase (NADPH)
VIRGRARRSSDITSHAAETVWDEVPRYISPSSDAQGPGHVRSLRGDQVPLRCRPGPSRLVQRFTREETEDALIELNYLGIENVLAIRGDGERRVPPEGRSANEGALDLVGQVAAMNRGNTW